MPDQGNPYLAGLYRFDVEYYAGDTQLGDVRGEVADRIVAAQIAEDGTVELVFEGGGTARPEDVRVLSLAAQDAG